MFMKEYRYWLDGAQTTFNVVVSYGEDTNIVNVFMNQEFTYISKQFNHVECGYYKLENNQGYHIPAYTEKNKGTIEHVEDFMDNYVKALSNHSVTKIVCAKCEERKFELLTDRTKVYCHTCGTCEIVKELAL